MVIDGEVRLEDKHAGVEVERRLRTHLLRPLHLLRAQLAVPNPVLRRVTPRSLTETVHHSMEMPITQIKQMIYVIKHLYVSVQVYYLTVLHKLKTKKKPELEQVKEESEDENLMKWLQTHLPDAEFGVVDDVVGHGELGLVLRRVHRLDLPDDAALVLQNAAVLRLDVRQYHHHKWVCGFHLSQPLGQPHHALHVVAVTGQESHICPAGNAGSLG